MTNEKSYELARDIRGTLTDQTYDEIARDVEANISRQITSASNDVLAVLAWDSFYDGCEAYDVAPTLEAFAVHFPTYAELI